ncbi:MAG: DEAD/DEAH box helicase [Chloroflexi bacterium]|nr:DEAD/DEAH box helicase [Chloroflexota bacterium]MCY3589250.1 DEAD/DEAH box helicase [Chloroflexota bacterium]MCY3685274.1 DEAD/DEAH box helicase [Chloroflexota bacterium]MDE2709102.1 DEAD/DEAH box helicase [Chloroflexota bacterium]
MADINFDLLQALKEFDAIRDGDQIQRKSVPAIPPTLGNGGAIRRLSRRMQEALRVLDISELYAHQEEAIACALDGNNVVLQAPTASGKSLSFMAPVLDTLSRDPSAHALLIYPMKALSQDQRDQLEELARSIPGRNIESWWYDGDTPDHERAAIRQKPPQILITTPEMINTTFLAHSKLWDRFLAGLKWIVIDEMHEYRGYFGSNVSLVLRRLLFFLKNRGVEPQVFLSSATSANAKEHAENLTGVRFEEVNAAAGMRPHREYVFVDPDIPDYQHYPILQLRAVRAALACVHENKSVLVFCPTRKFAEDCHWTAMREIPKLSESKGIEVNPEVVKVFRGGLSVEERHETREGLRRGDVRLVFTTNALELGLDIGGLDGVILAGFPDNIMAAWQRIGRAGRKWDSDAFVLYYARNNPLDQFYARNLETFLDRPLDDLVASAGNEELIKKHLPALLYESEDLSGGEEILGEPLHAAAVAARESGAKPARIGSYRPHQGIDLRGGGPGGRYVVMDGEQEIGTLSAQQLFREAFPRAIYMHGGRRFRVKEIVVTSSGGEVTLESVEQHLRTNPSVYSQLFVNDILDGCQWSAKGTTVSTIYGKVTMAERITAVNEIDDNTGEVVDHWVPGSTNANFNYSNAHSFWMVVDRAGPNTTKGIVTIQHLLRVGAMFSMPIDAHDVGPHCDIRESAAYLLESYPGGIGIASKALEKWREILRVGIEIAQRCDCRRGCPNCIVPPRSRENIDKRAGIEVAELVLAATEGRPQLRFAAGAWLPVA